MRLGNVKLRDNDARAILFELTHNHTSPNEIVMIKEALETRERILDQGKES
ncbi:hypothetical protein WD019_14460 [Fictibacillus sp. Mic-4]|uniref:hypothetical protein n=1 Tax=Fictibacillus TaxID=1329200 RepID=UPI00040C4906|nr:hypothetical protein [Fictibacillus gelatini]